MPRIERGTSAFDSQPCVGLFGTCGPTTHRGDIFIPVFEVEKIRYYNPQLGEGEWVPEEADYEADHLVHDVVQTWPATGATYGSGTLGELGYSISASLKSDSPYPKFLTAWIEQTLADNLDNPVAREESLRARRLTQAHLERTQSPNVFIVDSLEQMLDTTVSLYVAAEALVNVYREGYNPAYQRYMDGRDQATAWARAIESGLVTPAR